MRKLTFPGFMERYVTELSYCGTCGIYALAREAAASNFRLREPLFLYAISSNKMKTLLAATKNTCLYQEYTSLSEQYDYRQMLVMLEKSDEAVSAEYHKVWRSYQSVANYHEREARMKSALRIRVLSMQQSCSVTTYRICQELRMNAANVNAWLKHDISSKVSLSTAQKVVEYLENYHN